MCVGNVHICFIYMAKIWLLHVRTWVASFLLTTIFAILLLLDMIFSPLKVSFYFHAIQIRKHKCL